MVLSKVQVKISNETKYKYELTPKNHVKNNLINNFQHTINFRFYS